MREETIPASEARGRFAELLKTAEKRRIAITKHGQKKVVLISVQELEALEETLAVLEDENLMRGIRSSAEDSRSGRVRDARTIFARLDSEFGDEGPSR